MMDEERKAQPDANARYPTGIQLFLLMTCVYTSLFLVSLDKLIISTAIPRITDEFSSADDIGWYGTAYLLANCAFQLFFGKMYTVFDVKATFLASILIFEIGSALCGSAPTSLAFIIGRAIAGVGSGGVLSGNVVIIVYTLPLHKRPTYQGFFGAVFGISSIAGPLVGGALTTHATWRWCFWLNLPIGAAAALVILLTLKLDDAEGKRGVPLWDRVKRLDAVGTLLLVAGVVSLCIALQRGGVANSWGAAPVATPLAIGLFLLAAFAAYQIWAPETKSTVPPRLLRQRSIASAFWVSCCLGAHMTIFNYYLPLWFQAIRGLSAVESGVRLLALLIPTVVVSVIAGVLVSRTGYYTPFLIMGALLSAVGTGLLTTLSPRSTAAEWAGFQVVYGVGLGLSTQPPNMAAQTVLPRGDVAVGASLMFFGQTLFAAVFVSVGQAVLGSQLDSRLAGSGVVSSGNYSLHGSGATTVLQGVAAGEMPVVLRAYNQALRKCFEIGLIMACLSVLGAVCMEWRNVRENVSKKGSDISKEEKGKLHQASEDSGSSL